MTGSQPQPSTSRRAPPRAWTGGEPLDVAESHVPRCALNRISDSIGELPPSASREIACSARSGRIRFYMEIRCCRRADLEALEWDGEYAHDRPIIEWAFTRTLERLMVMLVADDHGVHVGQLWIDFARRHGVADVWAVRVKPTWRGRGVGTRLLQEAERHSAARGVMALELEVEPANVDARRLYERRGFVHVRTEHGGLETLRKVLPRARIVEHATSARDPDTR